MPKLEQDAEIALTSAQADEMVAAYLASIEEPILALDCERRLAALPPEPDNGPSPIPGPPSKERQELEKEQRTHEQNAIAAQNRAEALMRAVKAASPHAGKDDAGWSMNIARGSVSLRAKKE